MSSSSSTLDQLWQTLGLDSLPPDAGSAENLGSTRVPDWEQATLRHVAVSTPPTTTERIDLPKISVLPPTTEAVESGNTERDLVVTGLLGEGGMGRVLLAHQASLNRDVAVKVPRANASKGTIKALISESLITGGLEHPGVIPVYSMASDAAGSPALVMKRVDGVSWTELIRHAEDPAWNRIAGEGTDRLETHVELLRQVCNAIAFAHRKGVLHRDIKPSNVLIGEFGEVYVADWGIASRKLEPGEHRKPSLVGSPVYMAPEMVTGDDAQMDERTDVFLLGATLYELLTGAPPWKGADLRAVLEAAWQCEPRPLPASAPAELAQICRKAMAPEKHDRFSSALEFREALSGFLRHRGSVRLARAADERLQTLLATLQSTSRENVYPLLSECRFGFSQALREWPENAVARAGLTRCLEATARHELSQGNLVAVRALLSELEHVPADLVSALAQLEKDAAETQRRQARLEQLSQEMDPTVASRQRVLVFAITFLAIGLVTVAPRLFKDQSDRLTEQLGAWMLTVRTAIVLTIFALAMWFGRRSLLSTRLNRRLTGMVAIAGLATAAQRALAGLMGFDNRETTLHNFVMVMMICATGGITLHWGFFWSAGAMAVGLAAALLVPGHESPLFNISLAGALVFSVLSWRGWSGELSLNKRD
jgi:eukaryotic-like serine/threonine-protein kinase